MNEEESYVLYCRSWNKEVDLAFLRMTPCIGLLDNYVLYIVLHPRAPFPMMVAYDRIAAPLFTPSRIPLVEYQGSEGRKRNLAARTA